MIVEDRQIRSLQTPSPELVAEGWLSDYCEGLQPERVADGLRLWRLGKSRSGMQMVRRARGLVPWRCCVLGLEGELTAEKVIATWLCFGN